MRLLLATLFLALAFVMPAEAARGQSTELQTEGGEISVRRPVGGGWRCETRAGSGAGFRLAEIVCRRSSEGGVLTLYAKDYSGPDETPEGICARDWTKYYLGAMKSVAKVQSRLERVRGRLSCGVTAEGSVSPAHDVQLREWYSATKGHVLVTTGTGPARLVEEQGAVIVAWREAVVFRAEASR